jgi:anti-sigma factor RsiW
MYGTKKDQPVDCKEVKSLIHPYVDGELDIAHTLEVDRHLSTCADCAQSVERTRAVLSAASAATLCYSAPPNLAARIQASLAPQPLPVVSPRTFRWQPLALAASLLAVSLFGVEWYRTTRHSASDQLIAELVDDHVRSLMANHLLDVASSDKHTVRPWFTGKIDFAPSVPDLKDHGIPLVGGRLDVLAGQPVAALVYQHGKHTVNVFVRPVTSSLTTTTAAAETRLTTSKGYNIASWNDSGFDYSAISDLNADELREFASLLRSASQPTR